MDIDSAFRRLSDVPGRGDDLRLRFRARMTRPPRVYHTVAHIAVVLARIGAWIGGEPSVALVAAALYHDAIYVSERNDNEARSAEFAVGELRLLGYSDSQLSRVSELIRATQRHQAEPGDGDAILLLDADLYILGAEPEEYAAYVAAIRTEYAHVSDEDWRIGRAAVMSRFLDRERIFVGEWEGREVREAQARRNIAAEIAGLARPADRETQGRKRPRRTDQAS